MLTAADVARVVGGVVEGDAKATVTGLAGLADARPGDLSFLYDPRYAAQVATTQASVVLVSEDWTGTCSATLVRVKTPSLAFAAVGALIAPKPVAWMPGVHPTAVVAPGVSLGKDVYVGPYCVIEPGAVLGDRVQLIAQNYVGHETVIGSDTRIYPLASLRERVKVGSRCIIHNGAVIGSDGFGYTQEGGRWVKVPQVGVVELGDDVEIGANTTIDRARFGRTVLGNGVKLDNLVQIAHNVRVGANTAMAAQVGVAGSAVVGCNCQIGGQTAVTGHIEIGDEVIVAGRSGVSKDIPAKSVVFGAPAIPIDRAKSMHAHIMRLPHLKKRIEELVRRVDSLEKAKAQGA